MKEIKTKGNLPKPLQMFAKTMARGQRSTEFWECRSASELEKLAKDKKCELHCMLDPTTSRGFLTGFDTKESTIKAVDGTSFVTLVMYFVEIGTSDYDRYRKMLHKHRRQQEEDMRDRQSRVPKDRFQPVEED